jgi:hypothetical protein
MLNRRGLLILGSAAASLTLIGNREVMALVPETDRFHRAAAEAQHLIDSLPAEYHAYMALHAAAPPRHADDMDSWNAHTMYFQTSEGMRVRQEWKAWHNTPDHIGWMKKTDDHFGDLLRSFPEEPTFDLVQKLFNNEISVDIFSDADLRNIVPGLVPMAVIRAMAQRYNAPLHMAEMPNFISYAERYRHLVMA